MPIHYVSFDLGSESMAAAYCKPEIDPKVIPINLQEYAKDAWVPKADESEIYYLESSDPNSGRSPRLRTLISLNDMRQPKPLEDSHATLSFFNPDGSFNHKLYEKSLFGFFGKIRGFLRRTIMPNPKIPFQFGARDIIPEVKARTNSGDPSRFKLVRYEPVDLIKHLITQIVNNLILKSSDLLTVAKDDIHLVLTIPNVYSLTHAESIKSFVKVKTGVKEVEIIYEADAVAYYIFDFRTAQKFPKLQKYLEDMDREKHHFTQVLTIDVGHGTTDLSLIQMQDTEGEDIQRFYVKARAGKSDGGGRLTYILAQYYNECLFEILNDDQSKGFNLTFDFLTQTPSNDPRLADIQADILDKLDAFISSVKKNISVSYKLDIENDNIMRTANQLTDLIVTEAATGLSVTGANFAKAKQNLKQRLLDKFLFKRKISVITQNAVPAGLKHKIKDYVKKNIPELLAQLRGVAEAREGNDNNNKLLLKRRGDRINLNPHNNTFTIVAGQASQFKPMQIVIKNTLKKWNIPEKYTIFLQGDEAKDACNLGAIAFKSSANEWASSCELHGTYGFKKFVAHKGSNVKFLNTRQINMEKKGDANFDVKSLYWLFYTPYGYKKQSEPNQANIGPKQRQIIKENEKAFFKEVSENIAWIRGFPDGKDFHIKYDVNNKQLVVNGQRVVDVATYGEVDKSIYPKVWPAVLAPLKKK